MEAYLDEEEMEGAIIYNEIKHHWRMIFEDNEGGVDGEKEVLHTKIWDVYTNNK